MEEHTYERDDGSNNSMNRISQLPRDILQHILYDFSISQKEAVKTCVLSKSWRHIWCTSHKIDFDESMFNGNKEKFLSVFDKILQGYLDQNLCIQDFRVSIISESSVSLLEKWIPIIILNMGVKKLSISLYSNNWAYGLPSIVFEAQSTLQDLILEGCNLYLKGSSKKMLLFKHLNSLELCNVHVDEETFHNIISSCPLIENVDLYCCEGLKNVKLVNKKVLSNFKNFYFSGGYYKEEDCSIEIDVSTLEFMSIGDGASWFHDHKFPNLKSLNLHWVRLPRKLFSDKKFSCYFPILEELIIFFCYGLEVLQLSSHSLKYFSYEGEKPIKLVIDAPDMRSFKFYDDTSSKVPAFISFTTMYSEWKSKIILQFDLVDSSKWFRKLNEMLKSLSQSEISLSICYSGKEDPPQVLPDHINDGIVFMNKHLLAVEHFSLINYSPSFSVDILNGLFRICRPRNMYYYSARTSRDVLREHKEVTEFLCHIFLLRGNNNGKSSRNHHQYYWQQDLEVVSLEIFDNNGQKWHNAEVYGATSNLSEFPDNKKIRFRIKWRDDLFS